MNQELGRLQRKVLEYLALHPKQNTQVIQRGLKIPDHNYPSVRKSLKALERQDLVKTEAALSKKKAPIRIWMLTMKGIAYVLAHGKDDTVLGVLAEYEGNIEFFKPLQQFVKLLSKETATKIFRHVGKAYFLYGEEFWNLNTFAKIVLTSNLDMKELKELRKAGTKVKSIKKAVSETLQDFKKRSKLLEY